MDDDKLEKLLWDIGQETIIPSEELIFKTNNIILKKNNIYLMIAIFMIINIVSYMITFYYFFFASNTLEKMLIYSVSSLATNCGVIAIIVFKDKIVPLFYSYQYTT